MIGLSKEMNGLHTGALMSPAELQEGFARLSRGTYFREASLDMTLSILTESAAQMTGIERVGVWALTGDQRELRCLELYERSANRHSSGASLSAQFYPSYFQALAREEAIVADAPYLHPHTAEFAVDYLPHHGITAKLDTPIHIRGRLEGVLCLEQVGNPQPWTSVHRIFAHALANLVTLALVEYEANEARRQAKVANERLRAVFEASRDALVLADGESGLVLDVNRRAEELFGCSRIDLIGRHQRQLHPAGDGERYARIFHQVVEGEVVAPVRAEILRRDGTVFSVEIDAEVSDVSLGRRMILGIFRAA